MSESKINSEDFEEIKIFLSGILQESNIRCRGYMELDEARSRLNRTNTYAKYALKLMEKDKEPAPCPRS